MKFYIALLVVLFVGCNRSADGPLVGTETGNALTVGGSGAPTGFTVGAAHVDIERIEILDDDCETWISINGAVSIDLLDAPAEFPSDRQICGVRLPIGRATLQGERNGEIVAIDISGPTIELVLPMPVPFAILDLDLTDWLKSVPVGRGLQIADGDDRATQVRQNIVEGAHGSTKAKKPKKEKAPEDDDSADDLGEDADEDVDDDADDTSNGDDPRDDD